MVISHGRVCRDFVIIGAGPYGLALAARLQAANVDYLLFGRVMSFWSEHVPRGTRVLSDPADCSFSHAEFDINAYSIFRGAPFLRSPTAEEFVAYGRWFQRYACRNLDERTVVGIARRNGAYTLRLEDGDEITASNVVIATGWKMFAFRPPEFSALPPGLVFHSSDLCDLTSFQGKKVAVIGSGQSALECAALLAEQNADVEVLARASRVHWRPYGNHPARPSAQKGLRKHLRTLLRVSLNNADVYRRLPGSVRRLWLERTLLPVADVELMPRLACAQISLSRKVISAQVKGERVQLWLDDHTTRIVDQVVLGTGYRVDVNSIPLLGPELLREIRQQDGYPVLNSVMESTAPRLYFAGLPAARSFGADMWFIHGAPWAAERICRSLQVRYGASHLPVAHRDHSLVDL
jgi:cation diffusion facilitator CzcD-associated flavoprotein CzcO